VTSLKNAMRFLGGAAAFALALGAVAAPASARDSYVSDGAGLFSAGTVTNLNQEIGDFAHQTGKEVVVVTVPSLDGATPQDAAEKAFAQQQVNGVLIFLAKAEKKDGIVGDTASKTFFPSGSFDNIREAMRGYFRTGDFDQGITTGVGLILSGYRSHERTLTTQGARAAVPTSSQSFGGGGMSLLWLILILLAGFLIIRAVFRALMGGGQRMMPPGYGSQGYGQQGGMPGYGMPGYGGGGGGGSFFSGLLGGLGGAFIGNELFGHQNYGGGFGGTTAGLPGTDPGQADQSGWQSDPGQADMGNSSFGDFGSSGGGFGDSGGFGGGDSGGGFGGGDSGGGW
jgi:uncharacterized membrane protein YgcG